ncbi:MAG: D-alanine--D-alanine ligase [Clostridioides sp.]|jgi:D-alanine-D-alanine ligase|nr:D-alanine--D-alanine ligase [Clostridioides sp.]
MKKKIAVVMGGVSTERDISLKSGEEVFKYLDRDKYDVCKFIIDEESDTFNKIPKDIDFAFIALHGKFGEDGKIQSIFEAMKIPYSGCDPLTSGIFMDKNFTKKILKSSNLPTAPWTVVRSIDDIDYNLIDEIGYPVFIKPNSGGSSVATFFVQNKEEVLNAVTEGLKVDSCVMIEKYIKGVEHTSFILDGEIYPTLVIKYDTVFFDRETKYSEEHGAIEEVIYLPEKLQEKVNQISSAIWKEFNCKGYVRIDLIINGDDVNVLEINTIPGMTTTSLIPKSAKAKGLSYPELLDKIIESSIK